MIMLLAGYLHHDVNNLPKAEEGLPPIWGTTCIDWLGM
jgi:hypothetical protein